MKVATVTSALLAVLAAGEHGAFAHPGHGHNDPQSWLHYLTEPVHVGLLAIVAVAAVAVFAWRRSRRSASGTPTRTDKR